MAMTERDMPDTGAKRKSPAMLSADRQKAIKFRERSGYWHECKYALTALNNMPSPLDVALGMGTAGRRHPEYLTQMRRSADWLRELADMIERMEKDNGSSR